MRQALFAIFFALAAGPTFARDIPVLGGEHDRFTRLVFYFGPDTAWQASRDGRVLTFSRTGGSFAIDRLFDRIGRDRISDARVDGGSLRIEIGCACDAGLFSIEEGVVLDIATAGRLTLDGATEFDTVFPATSDPPGATLPLVATRAVADTVLPFDPDADASDTNAVAPDLDAAQAALSRQLARAASQGLIALEPDDAATSETNRAPTFAAPSGMRMATAVDDAFLSAQPAPKDADGIACLSADALDVAAWGADGPVSFGALRQALVGDLDSVDHAAVRRLVQAYLHASFGAEARGLGKAFGVALAPAQEEMALILDGLTVPDGALAAEISCDGPSALWAVLARDRLSSADRIDISAVLTAFNALPAHLRHHLGPRLASRFLGIDDVETARRIRAAMDRSAQNPGPPARLLDIEIETAAGYVAPTDSIAAIERESGAVGQEASLLRIRTILDQGAVPEEGDLVLLAALAQEHSGTDFGKKAQETWIATALAMRRLDTLARRLAGIDPSHPGLHRHWAALFGAAAHDALIPLLPVTIPAIAAMTDPPERIAAERALGRKLIAMGLPQNGRDLILGPDAELTEADRIAVARSHLAEGQADLTIAYLAGLSTQSADKLRDAALSQSRPEQPAPSAVTLADDTGTAPDLLQSATTLEEEIRALLDG